MYTTSTRNSGNIQKLDLESNPPRGNPYQPGVRNMQRSVSIGTPMIAPRYEIEKALRARRYYREQRSENNYSVPGGGTAPASQGNAAAEDPAETTELSNTQGLSTKGPAVELSQWSSATIRDRTFRNPKLEWPLLPPPVLGRVPSLSPVTPDENQKVTVVTDLVHSRRDLLNSATVSNRTVIKHATRGFASSYQRHSMENRNKGEVRVIHDVSYVPLKMQAPVSLHWHDTKQSKNRTTGKRKTSTTPPSVRTSYSRQTSHKTQGKVPTAPQPSRSSQVKLAKPISTQSHHRVAMNVVPKTKLFNARNSKPGPSMPTRYLPHQDPRRRFAQSASLGVSTGSLLYPTPHIHWYLPSPARHREINRYYLRSASEGFPRKGSHSIPAVSRSVSIS